MDIGVGLAMPLGDIAAGIGSIQGHAPARAARESGRCFGHPAGAARAVPVADDQFRLACPGRHRMAIEQNRTAIARGEAAEFIRHSRMERPVRLVEPPLEIATGDRRRPQAPVSGDARGDDAQPGGCAARSRVSGPRDQGGIDVVGRAVAIDCRSRCLGNDGAMAGGDRTPDETVYQRILERLERGNAGLGLAHQPIRVGSSGMRDRQQDGQRTAMSDHDRGRESGAIQVPSLVVPKLDGKPERRGAAGKCRALEA